MGIGFYQKKAKGRSTGYHGYTRKDMKRVGWCMRKGIFVSILPNWEGGSEEWKISIKINNKTYVDPKVYNPEEANKKMYEYYKYYYDKNKR